MTEPITRTIALCGPKTCGKDTLAQGLFKQNTQRQGLYIPFFARAPFAGGVKAICKETFGWSMEQQDDPVFKETPLLEWPSIEPRWAMMDIANFMREKYGPDVWVHRQEKFIKRHQEEDPHGAYVITDLRFPNEIQWLEKQPNHLLIYVHRTEAEKALQDAKDRGDPKALNPSEAHYDMLRERASHVLYNDGTILTAQHDVMNLVRRHFDHWTYWGMGPFRRAV